MAACLPSGCTTSMTGAKQGGIEFEVLRLAAVDRHSPNSVRVYFANAVEGSTCPVGEKRAAVRRPSPSQHPRAFVHIGQVLRRNAGEITHERARIPSIGW